ncbi:MAG: site-2 protease family protein [Planctomycetaceae bacterium]
MFLPTRGTAYDLRFSLFGIPVTVSPFFWVTAGLLGFSKLFIEPGGPANLIAWILCVFLSILLHEFGHALTMRAFRHDPEVVLHHFGGYATYRDRGRETPFRSLLISAAGPAIQLVLFAMLLGLYIWLNMTDRLPESGTPLWTALASMLEINLIWPIVNMLPVLPLDGGRMLSSILSLFGVRSATDWALKVGVFVGVIAAVFFLVFTGSFLAGAMFAFMAMENYQTLKGQQFGM